MEMFFIFNANSVIRFLVTFSLLASGLSCLSANAILRFSEKIEDKSPYSFLSDEEYSKIKDFDKFIELIDNNIYYRNIAFDNIRVSVPYTVIFKNKDVRIDAVFTEHKRGFEGPVAENIFIENKDPELPIPIGETDLSAISKEERKKLISDLEDFLKVGIINRFEETIRNYKNKKVIRDDKNYFECLLTISPYDVKKIIKINNNASGLKGFFYCPLSIKIEKEKGKPKNLTMVSFKKNTKNGFPGEGMEYISVDDIASVKDLKKYFYDIAVVFKRIHDSCAEDKSIKKLEDIVSGLRKI